MGDDSPRSDIYVVAPDGTGLRALTSTPDLVEYAPTLVTGRDPPRLRAHQRARPSSAPCTSHCELVVVDPSTGVETFSADIPQADGAIGNVGAVVPRMVAGRAGDRDRFG